MVAQVVVVGAGYAGAMAANRLAAVGGPQTVVTVINPWAEFVERIRLHEFGPFTHAVGTWQGVAALRMRARTLASGSSVVVVGAA